LSVGGYLFAVVRIAQSVLLNPRNLISIRG